MTKGATLEANFHKKNNGILVDLKFEKRKGCTWNPLNLLGAAGFKSGKDLNANEREELQKRVKQIERRLCYITDKIDQCEQSRLEEEENEEPEEPEEVEVKLEDIEEIEPATEPETEIDPEELDEKTNNGKSSQNFMVLLKQQKMKRRCRDPGKMCTEKCANREPTERRKKPPNGESKSFVLCSKPCVEREYKTDDADFDNQTANINKLLNQGHTIFTPKTTQPDNISMQHYNTQNGDQINSGRRILSNEPVTKKNVKMIIDEAVVDSIGKTLHKYFKEGLEKYIKNRVESALNTHTYKDVDAVSCYTPQSQSGFSHRPKKRTKESIELLHNYQSSVNDTEHVFKDAGKECSVKTSCSRSLTNITMPPEEQIKFQKDTNVRCKYSDIRSWVNKRQRLKPSSAASDVRSILNIHGTESNKTIQILKGNIIRPFTYERTFPRKLIRRRYSKDSLS